MEEGILLTVVTIAMAWLCLWTISDRGKPSKYWWPFDMPIHERKPEKPIDAPDAQPNDWRNRRQDVKPERDKRAWRRSGS